MLDVGANVGQYRDFLRNSLGFSGWIHSFEPMPDNVAILRERSVRDSRWRIHNFALGDEEKTMELNVTKESDLCSFLSPLEKSIGMQIQRTAMVQTKRLDSVVQQLTDTCILGKTFLKLDTQGYDLNVLRGGARVLQEIPLVQTELSFLPIYKDMPHFVDVFNYLKQMGFDLTGMFPVSRDAQLRVREFDGIFLNGRLHSEDSDRIQPSSQ